MNKESLELLRNQQHSKCLLCGSSDHLGLNLSVKRNGPGRVIGYSTPNCSLQSYPGELHGGIVSLLIDGIMTNCLFAEGITAVTARLNVRYLHPVDAATKVELRANLTKSKGNVYFLEACLLQGDMVKVKGSATFMERK